MPDLGRLLLVLVADAESESTEGIVGDREGRSPGVYKFLYSNVKERTNEIS